MSRRATSWQLAAVVLCAVAVIAQAGPALATFHGKNGRIALQTETAAHGVQLVTVQPATGAWRRVTEVAGYPLYPDWSPDGRVLAFEVDSPSGDQCRIKVVRADGRGAVRNLSHGRSACEQNPSFTPDGRRIVYVSQRCSQCTEGIWSMNLRGHDRRRIVASPPGMHAKDPNVSPDGTRVSFVAETNQNLAGLFIVGIHGRGLRMIVPTSYDVERKHDWAPDGRSLLVDDNANETDLPSDLITVRPDGSHFRRLTHFTDAGSGPRKAHVGSYSPDGRWIVYRVTRGEQTWWLRRPVDGGAPRRITFQRGLAASGNGDWGASSR